MSKLTALNGKTLFTISSYSNCGELFTTQNLVVVGSLCPPFENELGWRPAPRGLAALPRRRHNYLPAVLARTVAVVGPGTLPVPAPLQEHIAYLTHLNHKGNCGGHRSAVGGGKLLLLPGEQIRAAGAHRSLQTRQPQGAGAGLLRRGGSCLTRHADSPLLLLLIKLLHVAGVGEAKQRAGRTGGGRGKAATAATPLLSSQQLLLLLWHNDGAGFTLFYSSSSWK